MYGYMQLYTDAMKIVFAKIKHLPDSGPTISETNDEITIEIFSRVVMWSLGMSHIMSPPTMQWGSLGLRTQMSPKPNAYQLTETRRNAWPTKSHQSIMVTIQSHTLYTPYTVRRTKLSKLKKRFAKQSSTKSSKLFLSQCMQYRVILYRIITAGDHNTFGRHVVTFAELHGNSLTSALEASM